MVWGLGHGVWGLGLGSWDLCVRARWRGCWVWWLGLEGLRVVLEREIQRGRVREREGERETKYMYTHSLRRKEEREVSPQTPDGKTWLLVRKEKVGKIVQI